MIAGLVWVACSNSVVSLAQQQNLPPAAEPANIVRLRQRWFYQQRAYPNKHIPPGARMKALRQLRKMEAEQGSANRELKQQPGGTISTAPATGATIQAKALSSTSWTLIGPQPTSTPFAFNPVSGRVTALAVDPTNSNVVYLGTAEGGVWKTTDGGQTWTPLTDAQPSLAVGSIAIDPQNPQTIYAGTGEDDYFSIPPNQSNYSLLGDNYYGAGLLKSTDGGASWTHIPGTFAGPFGPGSFEGGAYISSLAVQPSNSQVLLAGVSLCLQSSGTTNCSFDSGIYRSTDGGQTWMLFVYGFPVTQVIFDPTNGLVAYAAFYQAGVYKSVDGGETWTDDNGSGANLLKLTNAGRVALAIDPENTATLYAGVAAQDGTFIGLYKTTDGGANWAQLASAPNYCSPAGGNPQCSYDNVVAVDPASSSVFVGGSTEGSPPGTGFVWRSEDGGSTWSDVDPQPAASGVQALHPDVHAIAFAADGSKVYVGTDGGVWSAANITTSPVAWANLNAPLALTQFYPGMSTLAYNPAVAFGGTQDNGTQEYSGGLQWASIPPCGDGGWTSLIGSDYPSILYWSCIWTQGLYRFNFETQSVAEIDTGINTSDRADFVPPFVTDPSHAQTLYFGTDQVYQSMDGGNSWTSISADLTGGSPAFLTTIAVAPSDPNTVYAGASDGRVAVTTTAASGASGGWLDISSGAILPNRWVTQVAIDPKTPTTAYVTYSGFSGFTDAAGHVFETTSGGGSWTDISGNLPNIPVNDIVADPDVPGTLYIATDIGVFEGMNPGSGWQWSPLGNGLPNVAVLSLKLNEASRILRAGTHGRSAWDLFVPAALPVADFSPPRPDFGQQLVSTTGSQTVTFTNTGTSSMTINEVSITGTDSADFAQSNNCPATLAAGGNCAISLTFTPPGRGTFNATLQVEDNAPGSPQLAYLSGQGVNPSVSLSPASLSFASQLAGTSSNAQTVTLTETGPDPIVVSSVAIAGADAGDFTETDNCVGTVAVNSSCTISVTFAPAAGGTRTGTMTITDNAASSPQTVPLSGTGEDFVVGVASGSPSSESVAPGSMASYSLSVTPEGGFNQSVSLNCSGAPSTTTCAVAPALVTLDGTNALTIRVTVATTGPGLAPPGPKEKPPGPGGFALSYGWVALLLLAGWLALALQRRRRVPLLAGAVLLAAVALSWGCGSRKPPGTPAGTYTLTVTGTSGSLSHQTTVTLTVQ